jgi:maltose O-acetyltransferase
MKDPLANRLLRYPAAVVMRLRIARLRLLGVRFIGKCWVRRVEIPRNPWDFLIEAASLDNHVVLLTTGERRQEPRVIIRAGVYINRFTMIDASEHIEIGENCMIGPYCYITDHDHGGEVDIPINQQPLVSEPVRIGRDVWLGAHVCVLKGVTIGDSAVIGAGAVVTKDVLPGAKMVGVPARQFGARGLPTVGFEP